MEKKYTANLLEKAMARRSPINWLYTTRKRLHKRVSGGLLLNVFQKKKKKKKKMNLKD